MANLSSPVYTVQFTAQAATGTIMLRESKSLYPRP
jgi:hypothetical protein